MPNVAFRTDKKKALRRTSKAHVYTCSSFPAPPFATPKPHRNASRRGYRNQPFRCCCSCCWLLLLLLRLPANFCCSLLFLPLLLLLLLLVLLQLLLPNVAFSPNTTACACTWLLSKTLPRLSTEPVKKKAFYNRFKKTCDCYCCCCCCWLLWLLLRLPANFCCWLLFLLLLLLLLLFLVLLQLLLPNVAFSPNTTACSCP